MLQVSSVDNVLMYMKQGCLTFSWTQTQVQLFCSLIHIHSSVPNPGNVENVVHLSGM